jgi:hypothetical protein
MNIATILLTAGIVSLAPPLTNPITLVDLNVSGISVSCGGEGCALAAADTNDFIATAHLYNGSTIRIRL